MDVNGAIEVMGASQIMGKIIAAAICNECPGLDEQAISETCATEIFYAAVDMKRSALVEHAQQIAQKRVAS